LRPLIKKNGIVVSEMRKELNMTENRITGILKKNNLHRYDMADMKNHQRKIPAPIIVRKNSKHFQKYESNLQSLIQELKSNRLDKSDSKSPRRKNKE
jgi:hypothetical protein